LLCFWQINDYHNASNAVMVVLACIKMAKGEVKTWTGMGIAVSTLQSDEDPQISDEHKSAFDWCKEGNVEVVQRLIQTNECDIQQLDENVI